MKYLLVAASTLLLALSLTACGGGGGGETSTNSQAQTAPTLVTATVTTTSPPVSDTTPNVTVSTPTYSAGDDRKVIFDLLNATRIQIGLGPQSQDAKLDVAAQGHSEWMALNKVINHDQAFGSAGFTGQSTFDRVINTGYVYDKIKAGIVGEALNASYYGRGASYAVADLLNAPYHALGLMSGNRDIGIGVGETSYVTTNLVNGVFGTTTISDFYYGIVSSTKITASRQLIGSDTVAIYPCNGITGVGFELRGENPSPVPSRNLSTNPLGTSVAVRVRDGQLLTLSAATMTKVSDGSMVPMRTPVTFKNDPNGPAYLDDSSGFISADVPMLPLTQYRAVVTGTNDGRPFSKTCEFKTKA